MLLSMSLFLVFSFSFGTKRSKGKHVREKHNHELNRRSQVQHSTDTFFFSHSLKIGSTLIKTYVLLICFYIRIMQFSLPSFSPLHSSQCSAYHSSAISTIRTVQSMHRKHSHIGSYVAIFALCINPSVISL